MIVLILLAFLLLPLLEIAAFILVGDWLGLLPTLALVILAGMAGAWLLRLQGFLMLRRMRESVALGEPPVFEVFNGFCLAAAAILLILPGFISDLAAFALLLPPLRRWLFQRFLTHLAEGGVWINGRHYSAQADSRTIEGDFTELAEEPPPGPRLPPFRRK